MTLPKILVVKIGAMGDVIMITPILKEIARRHPESEIHFLVGIWSALVLKRNPHIQKLRIVPDAVFYKMKPLGLLKLWLKLFFSFYRKIYLFHRNHSYFIFFSFLAPKLIGSRRQIFSYLPLMGRDHFPKGVHNTLSFWRILCEREPQLFQGVLDARPDFPFLPEDVNAEKMHGIRSFWKAGQPSLLINPGGGSNPGERVTVRQWGADRYVELIRMIAREYPGFRLLFSGGKDDEALCDRILRDPGLSGFSGSLLSVAGRTTLLELRALLSEADLFVTGDTGGMHIAAATGIPMITIFGPTDPVEKAPLSPNAVVVKTGARCAPCYHGKFKGCSYAFCMTEIPASQVFLETRRLLDKTHALKK